MQILRKFANKYGITGKTSLEIFLIYFSLLKWKFKASWHPWHSISLQNLPLSLQHNEAAKLKCATNYKSFRSRTFCFRFILRDMRCGKSFPSSPDVKERRTSFIPTFTGTLCVMNFESLHLATRIQFTAVIKFRIFGVVAFLWARR